MPYIYCIYYMYILSDRVPSMQQKVENYSLGDDEIIPLYSIQQQLHCVFPHFWGPLPFVQSWGTARTRGLNMLSLRITHHLEGSILLSHGTLKRTKMNKHFPCDPRSLTVEIHQTGCYCKKHRIPWVILFFPPDPHLWLLQSYGSRTMHHHQRIALSEALLSHWKPALSKRAQVLSYCFRNIAQNRRRRS